MDYALWRWSIEISLLKIDEVLVMLQDIKSLAPAYDWKSNQLPLDDYIDTIHLFCHECLDHFDFAQIWLADYLSGACGDGIECEDIDLEKYQFVWGESKI